MTKRLFTLVVTMLAAIGVWAEVAPEVWNFKTMATADMTVTRGEAISGFNVNNGQDRQMYQFSFADLPETDFNQRFAGYIGSANDGNFALKNGKGLLLKGRILSVMNLKNGDKVQVEYTLASSGSMTLADYSVIGQTSEFASGTEYTVTTSSETTHLDILSSANNNYVTKVTVTPYVPEPDVVPVFITAGQSNTDGRCMNENLPDYIKALDGHYVYTNWSYTNGGSRKSESEGVWRKYWPEMSSTSNNGRFAYDAFTYYYIEQALQKDFYVVKHSYGGTSIDPSCTSSSDYHWSADPAWLAEHQSCNEGGTSMLKALVSNIGKSIDALAAEGKTADVKCMFWHQGESDRSGTGPDGYHDNLQAVVQYVRDYLVEKTGDSKYATLPFVCGTVPKESKQYNKKVYNALFTLQSEDPNFHVIETSPGTFIGDQLHFDANCAERLGIGMYNKIIDLGLIEGKKQAVPEANVPKDRAMNYDFRAWVVDNMDANGYWQLNIDKTKELTNAAGTKVYPIVGVSSGIDFSEFADRFAVSDNVEKQEDEANTWVSFRKAGGATNASTGLRTAKNRTVALSLFNLSVGDTITITCDVTENAPCLKFLSTNAYLMGDDTKTPVAAETAVVSGQQYVITEGTQVDFSFGGTGQHYIYAVKINPFQEESTEPGGDTPKTPITVHTIGDSTMSSYDQSIPAQQGMDGWGDYLKDCMNGELVTVCNWADRGETARSYLNGIWNKLSADRPEFGEPIKDKVQAGDYVILQFGHNDSKAYSTADYESWMGQLVDAVREKGATPIIASSICRARFDSNGNITRLGRIDTGEENGVDESNHDYDYPYHARLVAEAKGVEFIDVTTGVKEMFETYGEAKTKALFPSGERTHTNKLGAQLIAKVAASLLQDTEIKDYVNADAIELPAAEDIEIVIDNFKDEAVVTKKTIWTFNDYAGATTIANGAVTNINGLYVRGGASSHDITPVAKTYEGTFSDGETVVSLTTVAHSAGGVVGIGTDVTAGVATSNSTDRTFAFNVGKPGMIYVIAASTGSNAERSIKLMFSGMKKAEIPFDKKVGTMSFHATTTGVVYVCGDGAFDLYAMMFVPDMEAGTEEDWNYQMLLTREEGWWTYTNMSGTDQEVPEGLTAYAVTEVTGGKAMLTNIGGVIPNGMGVIVKGEADTEYAMPVAATEPEYTGANLLKANTVLRYLPATEDDKTCFYFDGSRFVKATGGETIHEKQAYLSVEGETPDELELSIVDDNTATDIDDLSGHNSDAIYDLNGRKYSTSNDKCTNAQLKKGVYIRGGRKMIVK